MNNDMLLFHNIILARLFELRRQIEWRRQQKNLLK
jgi:hypothetical protein